MKPISDKEAIILELLSGKAEMYGLEMVHAKKEIKRGTVYVTLGRMEKKGLVESRQDEKIDMAGMPRRLYKITGYGQAVLNAYNDYMAAVGRLEPQFGV